MGISVRSHATTALASLLTERQWMTQVTELAEMLGWTWAHFRPAQTTKGWRTPVSGPMGKGFPDLIMARGDRLIFAELKAQDGRLTPEQRAALDVLRPACEVHVWRPTDLPLVAEVLR